MAFFGTAILVKLDRLIPQVQRWRDASPTLTVNPRRR